jgi:SNF family Na+-dependent transporter
MVKIKNINKKAPPPYLTGKKWLNVIGWNGNLAVFILFGFYSVIGGWIIIYTLSHFLPVSLL